MVAPRNGRMAEEGVDVPLRRHPSEALLDQRVAPDRGSRHLVVRENPDSRQRRGRPPSHRNGARGRLGHVDAAIPQAAAQLPLAAKAPPAGLM